MTEQHIPTDVTADQIDASGQEQLAPPSAGLAALDRLVGSWTVTGGAEGTVTYEWMTGGYFLLQRVELQQFGQPVTGLEVIGNLHPFGEPVGEDVVSRFYDSMGNTLDYVYELTGDTLMIWGGAKGSPAYFEGRFSDGDSTMAGEWVYPGGGGYASTMTRL
ncbi:conserved hypothetical protein [Beutenbergia cavernae DSM 12333]|uniref:DUF1579 domain-containing protein n=1 Tax=Beutenbergia cavernae (strain ATCC BAA-8 / DSM 12333 / CCUG 43141 / JCM 11478 / NBRC 16432 / NCIMB 13614 / HKI 0122) TaxID=471853 RepID=C5C612_BEUC1|nr:hypothetical protein [Beutenbergia cavernae]ACQ82370.1 conserved hypothetical protein [Beutenbergia cavernae DSM 12333]